MEDNSQTIVIDNGSGYTKVGFSGDEAPRNVFRSVVGRPKMPNIMVGMDRRDSYIGDEAIKKRGILRMNNPISRGFIDDWKDIEKIWHYSIYEELSVIPEQTNVLMTEPPLNRRENREKMTEIMFETFNVNRF